MNELKPIQTKYNGHFFRSRLEARWAVFFATLGVEYRYEPEGFDLGGTWYLPDFWVPDLNAWVEIKPFVPEGDEFFKLEQFNAMLAQHADGPSFYVLAGDCWREGVTVLTSCYRTNEPVPSLAAVPAEVITCPLCSRLLIGHVNSAWNPPECATYCYSCDAAHAWRPEALAAGAYFHKGDAVAPSKAYLYERTDRAFSAARAARFER